MFNVLVEHASEVKNDTPRGNKVQGNYFRGWERTKLVLEGFPKLKEVVEGFRGREGMQKYLNNIGSMNW